jgi:serine/threonine protein kinase
LVRSYGDTERVDADILNEVRAIEKLRKNGGHPNIITVFDDGWLNDDVHYFFDMELCVLNLERFIQGNFGHVLGLPQYLDPQYGTEELGCLNMWSIMTQITSGLEFMHSLKQLHRDLKPQNGVFILRLN